MSVHGISFVKKRLENAAPVVTARELDYLAYRVFGLDFAEIVKETLRSLLAGSRDNAVHDYRVGECHNAIKRQALVLLRASILCRLKFEVDHARLEILTMGVIFAIENDALSLDFSEKEGEFPDLLLSLDVGQDSVAVDKPLGLVDYFREITIDL